MDTKLKKFSYSKSAKAIAFVLALVIVALMANCAVSCFDEVENNSNFSSSTISDAVKFYNKDFDITESSEFYDEFSTVTNQVSELESTYKDGGKDALNAYLADCKEELNDEVQSQYEYIVKTATADGAYFDTTSFNDGEITRATKNDFDFSVYSEEMQTTYYYNVDMDLVRKNVEIDNPNLVEKNAKKIFAKNYKTIKSNIADYKNIKVAIVDKNGTVYSNIDSVKNQSQVQELFSSYDWYTKYNYATGAEYSDLIEKKFDKSNFNDFYGIDVESDNPNYIGYFSRDDSSLTYYMALDTNLTEQDDLSIAQKNVNEFLKIVIHLVRTELCLFVLLMILTVYTVLKSGRKQKNGEVKLNWIDKHYSFIHILISGVAIFGLGVLMFEHFNKYFVGNSYKSINVPIIAAAIYGVFLEWLTSFARNIKAHSFLKNTVFYAIYKKIKTTIEKNKEKLPQILKLEKPIKIFAIVYGIVMGLIILITIPLNSSGKAVFLFIAVVINLAIVVFAIISAKGIAMIMTATEQAKIGNFDYKIDLTKIPFWLRGFANSILTMQSGTKIAIENAVKDEKMKTELITNVSHDLKTPLTSIVNYVDLLSKLELNNADADKYIGVLVEKSDRLKKLIEDLTEAAKASSGAINIHIVNVNLNEIAAQIAGEISDELSAKGIEIILKTTESPVFVQADSRLTFRILENLVSNVKKYALFGTRAYIIIGDNGTISVSNISKYPIDVSAEELTGRFVRGDASRSSEGSGLGLSIAKDFANLQNGKIDITAECDMFKVTLTLPKV